LELHDGLGTLVQGGGVAVQHTVAEHGRLGHGEQVCVKRREIQRALTNQLDVCSHAFILLDLLRQRKPTMCGCAYLKRLLAHDGLAGHKVQRVFFGNTIALVFSISQAINRSGAGVHARNGVNLIWLAISFTSRTDGAQT
jgi:hypothetical protein